MKIIRLLLVFVNFSLLFAQEKPAPKGEFTARQVSQMVIYPGCENIDSDNKIELQKCLQRNLTELLVDKLNYFSEVMEQKSISDASAKIRFVVSKEGKIVEVQAMSGGSIELSIAAENALKQIANEIPTIQPARLEGGQAVNLFFQLPVRFSIQTANSILDYNGKELVNLTLMGENENYELRIPKDNQSLIKVYAITNESEIFLGTYSNLSDIVAVEPYKSLLKNLPNRMLVAQQTISGQAYKIYATNLDLGKLEVYQVQNETEVFLGNFSQKELLGNDIYGKIIIR